MFIQTCREIVNHIFVTTLLIYILFPFFLLGIPYKQPPMSVPCAVISLIVIVFIWILTLPIFLFVLAVRLLIQPFQLYDEVKQQLSQQEPKTE